jgi:hypothetical protein
MRLFAVACCRHWADRITHPASRELVDLAERFADGEVPARTLARVRRVVFRWAQGQMRTEFENLRRHGFMPPSGVLGDPWEPRWAAYMAAVPSIVPPVRPFFESADCRAYLLDVLGGAAEFDPSWRTEAVVSLARGMYEARDFAPMPVLADALEDAGCGDADLLAHRRGPGPHVRGCWVVDLVLGKG